MKIPFFSTQPYDKEYFVRHNKQHEILFFEASLNEQTVNLAKGCDAVCCFVNDQLSASIIKLLAEAGIKIIALRCAGFNNVDLAAAKKIIWWWFVCLLILHMLSPSMLWH